MIYIEKIILQEEKNDVIHLEHVYFTYEGSHKENLTDINLSIEQGEFIVITGESGCGKTTLTRCINGLIPSFYKGELKGKGTVCKQNITSESIKERSYKVGSVFQDPRSQFFTMHVKTEISFPSENHGIHTDKIQKSISKTVDNLKLLPLMERKIFDLSSGEKQKVALASVYALGSEVYVLDEPSANLDDEGTRQLYDILKILKEKGCTIIVSEHKLYYLKNLIDRVIYMREGRIQEIFKGEIFISRSPDWFHKKGLRQVDLKQLKTMKSQYQFDDLYNQSSPLLRVRELSFGYGRDRLLWNNISFESYAGEVVGIVGRNGIGKSSLVKVLMGLSSPKQGRILLNEKTANKRKRIKNSSYVMQDVDYQFFAPSVMEEMLVGLTDLGEEKERANKYLKYFQLDEWKDCHPATLSGGQKQRLAIAIACMHNTNLLFLDEPTSGLDAANMNKVSHIIHKLAKENRSIFVITHDYEFAVQTFDSILYFNDENTVSKMTLEEYLSKII